MRWFSFIGASVLIAGSLGFWWPQEIADPQPRLVGSASEIIEHEKTFRHLKPEHRKKLYIPPDVGALPPVALVYLHGFSATPVEVEPLMSDLAEKLRAPLFFGRLTGHGLTPQEFSEAKAESWRADADEALAVGKTLGKKVVLVGCSTGAILLLDAALRSPQDVAALIMISPNFRPKSPLSPLLAGPLGPLWAYLVFGEISKGKVRDPLVTENWLVDYPSKSLVTLMNYVQFSRNWKLENFKSPVMTILSDGDEVVSLDLAESQHLRFPSQQKRLLKIAGAPHVLAGRYRSPGTTVQVGTQIENWLASLQSKQ